MVGRVFEIEDEDKGEDGGKGTCTVGIWYKGWTGGLWIGWCWNTGWIWGYCWNAGWEWLYICWGWVNWGWANVGGWTDWGGIQGGIWGGGPNEGFISGEEIWLYACKQGFEGTFVNVKTYEEGRLGTGRNKLSELEAMTPGPPWAKDCACVSCRPGPSSTRDCWCWSSGAGGDVTVVGTSSSEQGHLHPHAIHHPHSWSSRTHVHRQMLQWHIWHLGDSDIWTKVRPANGWPSGPSQWVWHDACNSDMQVRLGLAQRNEGLRKSKPEPQAFKNLSRPKPWAYICWELENSEIIPKHV